MPWSIRIRVDPVNRKDSFKIERINAAILEQCQLMCSDLTEKRVFRAIALNIAG